MLTLNTAEEPHQVDSVPISQELTMFHKFTELPAEIRQEIFKLTFPSRRVELCSNQTHFVAKMGYMVRQGLQCSIPTPVSFNINRESRQTSLLYYTALLKSSKPRRGPVYFNPDLDTLCFPDGTVNSIWLADMTIFEHLHGGFLRALDFVQYLEAPEVDWDAEWSEYLRWGGGNGQAKAPQPFRNFIFFHFRGLRKLVLVQDPISAHMKQPKLRENCVRDLLAWYEERHEWMGDFKVPEISWKS